MKITFITNIVFEPYLKSAVENYLGDGLGLCVIPIEEYLNTKYIEVFEKSNYIVVWLSLEALIPSLVNHMDEEDCLYNVKKLYEKMFVYLKQITTAKIIAITFEMKLQQYAAITGNVYYPYVDDLNVYVKKMGSKDIHFIDLNRIIAEIGLLNAYDDKSKYRWNAPYSKLLIEKVVKEIHKLYLIEGGSTKKCIVLDCDNVLWKGIVSEDGIGGVKLGGSGVGRYYQDFQRFLLFLYNHGVILTICSKNDKEDIINVFRTHTGMVLQEKHISWFQVNWENKPKNIIRIAQALNIGLDSIVFVDDSPIEIEAVKALIPEVTTILFDKGLKYSDFSCFNLRENANRMDIEKRTTTYQTNMKREELKASSMSYEDYIESLNIKVTIHCITPDEYARVSELTQRTNKCTNGTRYKIDEIMEHDNDNDVNLFSVYVSDCFSDLGLVGVIEIKNECIQLFSLSCRAMGREVEMYMIKHIKNRFNIKSARFCSTGKNNDIKLLLLQNFAGIKIEETFMD